VKPTSSTELWSWSSSISTPPFGGICVTVKSWTSPKASPPPYPRPTSGSSCRATTYSHSSTVRSPFLAPGPAAVSAWTHHCRICGGYERCSDSGARRHPGDLRGCHLVATRHRACGPEEATTKRAHHQHGVARTSTLDGSPDPGGRGDTVNRVDLGSPGACRFGPRHDDPKTAQDIAAGQGDLLDLPGQPTHQGHFVGPDRSVGPRYSGGWSRTCP